MQVVNAPRLTMRRPNTLQVKSMFSDEEHFISFESKEEKVIWHTAIVRCLVDQKTWQRWSTKVIPVSPQEPWKHHGPARGHLGGIVASPAPKVHTNVIERTSTASPLVPPREKRGRRIEVEKMEIDHHDNQEVNQKDSRHSDQSSNCSADKENTNHSDSAYVEMAPLSSPIEQKKRRAPIPPTPSPRPQPRNSTDKGPVLNGSSPSTPQSAKKRRAPEKPRDQLAYKGKTQESSTHLYTAV